MAAGQLYKSKRNGIVEPLIGCASSRPSNSPLNVSRCPPLIHTSNAEMIEYSFESTHNRLNRVIIDKLIRRVDADHAHGFAQNIGFIRKQLIMLVGVACLKY